jgi:predicted outer membrane repeat protein
MIFQFNKNCLALILILVSTYCQAKIIHVAEGKKSGDGSTWSKAKNDLKNALDSANAGDSIWVAKGVYYPTSGFDRSVCFVLKEGITLLGGFKKGASKLSDRDWKKNETILSGDIGKKFDSLDNSYTILRTFGAIPLNIRDCYIDGFVFEHGQADSSAGTYASHAGAIYLDGSNMRLHVKNCKFISNYAESGGALSGFVPSSFTNCLFQSNRAKHNGAGYAYWSSFYGCEFNNNRAEISCGALRTSYTEINGCRFVNNFARQLGGALYTSAFLTDSYFENNHVDGSKNANGGAVFFNTGSRNSSIKGCTFLNNSASQDGGAIYSRNTAWTLKDSLMICESTFNNNVSGGKGGALYYYGGTFFLTNSVFMNNKCVGHGSAIHQYNKYYFASNVYKNSSFYNNKSDSNSTIYFYNSSGTTAPSLINCILNKNDSSTLKTAISSIYNRSNISLTRCIIDFNFNAKDTIRSNPNFLNPFGPDNIKGTIDDNLALNDFSPAINSGLDTSIIGSCGSYTDVGGNPRINFDTIDIGANEKVDCSKIRKPQLVTSKKEYCKGDSLVIIDTANSQALGRWESADFSLTDYWTFNDTLKLELKDDGSYVFYRKVILCDSSILDSLIINVKRRTLKPTLVKSTKSALCKGDTLELKIKPKFDNYKWSTGDSTKKIEVTESKKIYVQVNDSGNCFSDTISIDVTFNKNPKKPIIKSIDTIKCFGDSIKIWTQNANGNYFWNNGANDSFVYADTTGSFMVYVVDSNGCKSKYSQTISVKIRNALKKPVIVFDSLKICEGDSLLIKTDKKYPETMWSTGATQDSLFRLKENGIWFHYIDSNGCKSVKSDSINIEILERPVPKIWVENDGVFCEGDSVLLRSLAKMSEYKWSNGDSLKTTWGVNSGFVQLQVNDGTCWSKRADTVLITKLERPTVVLELIGDDNLCKGEETILKTKEAFEKYEWSNNQSTRDLIISNSGEYSVKVTDKFGCVSDWSDVKLIQVNPLPPSPDIIFENNIKFCKGDSIILSGPEGYSDYLWNKESKHGNTQKVFESGTWQLEVVDSNGCKSPSSEAVSPVRIDVPFPNSNIIGDSSFCDGDSVIIEIKSDYDEFIWSNGSRRSSLIGKESGSIFFVGKVDICYSDTAFFLLEKLEQPVKPEISKKIIELGCNPEFELTTTSLGNEYEWLWQEGKATEQTINVNENGSYSLRTKSSDGCWSDFSDTVNISTIDAFFFETDHLQIYPNPTNSSAILTTQAHVYTTNKLSIKVVNLQGKLIHEHIIEKLNCEKLEYELPIENWPTGFYLIHISSGVSSNSIGLTIVD